MRELKQMADAVEKELQIPIIAAISKPYRGISGIRRSCEEAESLFAVANLCDDGYLAFSVEVEEKREESGLPESDAILRAVRKNNLQQLKQAFVDFIYGLSTVEEERCRQIHYMMVKVEVLLSDFYGMSGEVREKFQSYYTQMHQLTALQAVNIYRVKFLSVK